MQFTDTIQLDGQELTATFTLIFTIKGHIFFIGLEKEGNRHFFDMRKQPDGNWKIIRQAPAWITDLEPNFSEIIVKRLNGFNRLV